MSNQELRFRRRVTTVGDQQPKRNLPVLLAAAASALIIVPALIYTALHPTSVSATVKQLAKHVPMQIKNMGRVAIVASRVTPTPQPTSTSTAAPSPTPAAKTEKQTAEQVAHTAHLKRQHELALAASHAKKLASTGQIAEIAPSTTSGNDAPGTTGSGGVTTPANTTAGQASSAAAATPQQPVADATPVYAPDMVVDARFTHQVQPEYPDVAREQNAQGTAVVLATIGPNGNVISTRIDQSTGNKLLDQAALAAARESSFEAPKINGKPATETYRLVYTFSNSN